MSKSKPIDEETYRLTVGDLREFLKTRSKDVMVPRSLLRHALDLLKRLKR